MDKSFSVSFSLFDTLVNHPHLIPTLKVSNIALQCVLIIICDQGVARSLDGHNDKGIEEGKEEQVCRRRQCLFTVYLYYGAFLYRCTCKTLTLSTIKFGEFGEREQTIDILK